MSGKKIFWQIFPSYLLITVLALTAASVYATRTLRHLYIGMLESDLATRARLVVHDIESHSLPLDSPALDGIVKTLGKLTATRITVILPSGRVVGESETNPDELENHRGRPEIQAAFAGRAGTELRYSATVRAPMMYVAVPLIQNQAVAAVVRTSLPATLIDAALRGIYLRILTAGVCIAVLAALLGYGISRRISRPLEMLEAGAERLAAGDFSRRLEAAGTEEISRLSEAMNRMAGQLGERIRTILEQRNQQEAILSSMMEGVIAVDSRKRILSLNQTAAQWLNTSASLAAGKLVAEIVHDEDLFRFISRTLENPAEIEQVIHLSSGEARWLHVHASPLCDAQGRQNGSVAVLHDITRLRKLENIRRDFVANVSHELKTPITSIKGSVETLLDGALRDPEDAPRFLEIISKQADRLNSIIDDLLSLSRIEQDEEKNNVPLEPHALANVLQSAIDACRIKAEEKRISILCLCDDNVWIRINPPLLEQALVNLIDNAIKYSPGGSEIKIEAEHTPQGTSVHVRDRGCGIAPEHLPRIFERFYRVDKARSRRLGGTGLGLSIVKHIIQAHGGQVSVQSTPGQGSTFSLHLPE